jgi:hypothetical protein
MKKLYYYLYRKVKNIPCRSEVSDVLLSGVWLSPGVRTVAEYYAMGFDIEPIALGAKMTRERTRQYLLKAVRGSKPLESSFICFAYSINDVDGKPKGLIWLMACFTDKNYRLFPIGYIK